MIECTISCSGEGYAVMEIWIVAVCAAVVLIAVVLLLIDGRRQQLRSLGIIQMRGSRLYQDLAPELKRIRNIPVDQILIERDRLIIKGMYPPDIILSFPLENYRRRRNHGTYTETLRDLLADELHDLNDPARYRLRSYRVFYPPNEKARAWEFIARPAYKSYVLRTRSWYAADVRRDD